MGEPRKTLVWPQLEVIEDAWCGSTSDARVLRDPSDGSTLTWTGETVFEQVLPRPPRGKIWCGSELVGRRSGTLRAPDVHPLHWHLMSESARKRAKDEYAVKAQRWQQARQRRTIPRVPLDTLPTSSAAYTKALGMHRLAVQPIYSSRPRALSDDETTSIASDYPALVDSSDSECDDTASIFSDESTVDALDIIYNRHNGL